MGILEEEEKGVLKAPWVLPGVPSTFHVEGLTPCGVPSLQMTLATCRVGGGAEDRGAGCSGVVWAAEEPPGDSGQGG